MVTWRVPSARITMPISEVDTPWTKIREPGWTTTGGQVIAQAPLQLDCDGCAVSLSKRYSVNPAPSCTIGFRPLAEPAVNCTHFIAAGSVRGPLKKSPVFCGALFCFAVPFL